MVAGYHYLYHKMKVKLESNAKINLALKILNQKTNGYHNISSIIQEISLSDILTISKNSSNHIELSCSGLKTPNDKTNLCYKAAHSMFNEFSISQGIDITLHKNIPVGAGLGGGSSNAASVIKGLIQLFDINYSKKQIISLSEQLGADVAFFISGGLQEASGIGSNLTPINQKLDKFYFLLVYPNIEISTKWAYNNYKKYLDYKSIKTNFLPLSDNLNWSLLENDFEKVVLSTYPEIREIKNELQKSDSLFSSLSGSGSTMFGVYDNLKLAERSMRLFHAYQTYLTLPVY